MRDEMRDACSVFPPSFLPSFLPLRSVVCCLVGWLVGWSRSAVSNQLDQRSAVGEFVSMAMATTYLPWRRWHGRMAVTGGSTHTVSQTYIMQRPLKAKSWS